MKYRKMLGLLAVAVAGLMAFAATASATIGTKSDQGAAVPVNETIHATNVGNAVIDGVVNISCTISTVGGKVTAAGGASETLKVVLETLTFEGCGADTVNVAAKGGLEFHTDPEGQPANGNGTITSNNAEITTMTHNILGTVHCLYKTNATDIGTIDGSRNRPANEKTATLTIDSVPIPRVSTDFGCGSSSEWTGHYTVTTPDYLDID